MDYKELREKIRTATHAGCTYHSEPICPMEGNHSCMYCEKMTDQILNIRVKDCELCEGDGWVYSDEPEGEDSSRVYCPNCAGKGGRTLGDILDLLKAGKLVEKENK